MYWARFPISDSPNFFRPSLKNGNWCMSKIKRRVSDKSLAIKKLETVKKWGLEGDLHFFSHFPGQIEVTTNHTKLQTRGKSPHFSVLADHKARS